MAEDILTAIHNTSGHFSKGQRAIANYIAQSYDKAAFMTASKLGKTVGVSESTVVRFAVELGYDGYPSMQKALQELVRNKLTSVQRIEVTNDRISTQDVASMVLQADMETIQLTKEHLDRQMFAGAVDEIVNARHVYIVGVRSSAVLVEFFEFYLRNMLDNVRVVTANSTSEMFEQMVHLTKEDVIIGISFPRYSARTVKVMQYCRDLGAKLIAITDSLQAPVAKISDYALVAKSDMVSVVDSLVAPLSLINALVVAIGHKREKELAATYAALERMWEEYEVYERMEG